MRVFRMGTLALILVAVIGSGIGSPASAAHNGNNRAVVTGTADADAVGKAVVNYSKGQGTFGGTITVRNLVPGETYAFQVFNTATMAVAEVCASEANSQGTFTCSFQDRVLPGFTTAQVVDDSGTIVASGTFDRAGNCRDADQAGSQCEAPGQHNHD